MASIDAEEALREVLVLQVAGGTIKRERALRALSRWRRLARKAPRKPLTEAEWRGRLAASGIKLQMVKKDDRRS